MGLPIARRPQSNPGRLLPTRKAGPILSNGQHEAEGAHGPLWHPHAVALAE
jgi:hypothetical protein